VGKRRRRVFLIYGSLAVLYGTLILVLAAGWLRNFLVNQLGEGWGYAATAAALYLMTKKKIHPALAVVRNRLPVWKERFMAWRMTRAQQVGVAAAGLLLLVAPLPRNTTSEFQLEPAARW